MMQAEVNHPVAQAEAFALAWQFAPPRALDQQIAVTFELICEQWDRLRESLGTLTAPLARERWLKPLFDLLEFRWVYQRGDVVLGEDEELRFDLSHRSWSE